MEEIWKKCLEFPQYEMSSTGGMRLCKIVRPTLSRGYMRAAFGKDGKQWSRNIHRMVWEAFHGPIPPGMVINHLNGIKTDNRIENLECCTPSQNSIHSYYVLGKTGTPPPYHKGSSHPRAKLTDGDCAEILALYATGLWSQERLGKLFGVSQPTIGLVTRGIRKS